VLVHRKFTTGAWMQ